MIQYQECPICTSEQIYPVLKAKDHTVSQKEFEIWECGHCTGRFTQKVPPADQIGAYYASENYISHSDTSKGLINRLYHTVRKHTLRQKKKLVERFTKTNQGQILDLGCGTGAFLHTMQQGGWKVTGMEPDSGAVMKAKELYGIEPIPPSMLDQLPASSFDAITLWHVLEHVHDLHVYMDCIKRLLKPGGILFIAVPNYTSYDAERYTESWAAYDVPRHLYHFSPASVEVLFARHGITLQAVKPMWFDSYYVSMLSESYQNGRTNPFLAAVTGFLSNMKAFGNTRKCSSVIYIASIARAD